MRRKRAWIVSLLAVSLFGLASLAHAQEAVERVAPTPAGPDSTTTRAKRVVPRVVRPTPDTPPPTAVRRVNPAPKRVDPPVARAAPPGVEAATALSPLIGTWSGMVDQSDFGAYPVVMKITSLFGGTIDYPSLSCGGTLKGGGGKTWLRVIETISYGKAYCVDGGAIMMKVTGPNTMRWEWADETTTITATLVKSVELSDADRTALEADYAERNKEEALDALGGIAFGDYHALVIGNNDYRRFTPLRTAVDDAKAVARVLREGYGFEVTLLTDATRDDILRALANYRRSLTFNDNLVIYYAGHGVIDEITDRGYWLPVDSDPDVKTAWIANEDITSELGAVQAKHVLVVADSCYSGTLRAAAPELDLARGTLAWVERMVQKRSRVALTSGLLEPVVDSGGGGHSVFARAFLEVLEANHGVLDGHTLFDRIRAPVVVNADQTPGYFPIRRSGDEGGHFLFVRTR